jgi:hypothetical protein
MNALMATGKVEFPYQARMTTPGGNIHLQLSQEYTDGHPMHLRVSLRQPHFTRGQPLLIQETRSRYEVLTWAHKNGFKLLVRHLMWHHVAENMGCSESSRRMTLTNVRPLLNDCDLTSLIYQHAGLQLPLIDEHCGRLLSYGFQFQVPGLVKHIYQHNPTLLYHVHESVISDFLKQYVAPRDFDVLQLVVAGANDNSPFRDGILLSLIRTTLNQRGTVGTVCGLLLDNGLELDSAAVGGVPLLSWASKESQDDLVQLILERCSVDVNATDNG